jgi:hypothetical protein
MVPRTNAAWGLSFPEFVILVLIISGNPLIDNRPVTRTLITQDNTNPNILKVETSTWIHTEDCSVRTGQDSARLGSYGHMIHIFIPKSLNF